MHAALVLFSLLLTADADVTTIRVVNTLEEPVAVKFRIVGKEEWIKSELTLDAAQTKNLELPKGDKYEVVVRDEKKKELPVGSWDFGKMLDKDPKAEIHIVQEQPRKAKAAGRAGSKGDLVPVEKEITETYAVEVPYTIQSEVGGKKVTRTEVRSEERTRSYTITKMVPAGSAGAAATRPQVQLSVYSKRNYYPIGEFTGVISAKPEKPAEKAEIAVPATPDGDDPLVPPRVIVRPLLK